MNRSLSSEALEPTLERLRRANAALVKHYPGESGRRQPIHTFYGGAHLFRADSAKKLGAAALRTLEEYAPDPAAFAGAIGLDGPESLARAIHSRVREKLAREPVEDFRIDFEDGYGNRADDEEDGHAEAAAREVAAGMSSSALPPSIGIRIKPLTEELKTRSIRTLDLFLTTLLRETSGRLPANFVVTLPKVAIPEQAAALADLLDRLEPAAGLPARSLSLEVMIEMPQAILNAHGEASVPRIVEAARGRCVAAHFGTYDYTAGCNITAAHQHLLHPACDFARDVMQVSLAGTGVWLSDGATNVLPVVLHRAAPGGPPLDSGQIEANCRAVHAAWRLHYEHVRHSLASAYYQGWDLHPAQLPTRYAAVYAFFLESYAAAAERLRHFVDKAAQATIVGEVFDDAATGQGLLNFFQRAVNCGAVTETEALATTGLTADEIRGRSFMRILERRRGG